jgi:hypothetical protein
MCNTQKINKNGVISDPNICSNLTNISIFPDTDLKYLSLAQ